MIWGMKEKVINFSFSKEIDFKQIKIQIEIRASQRESETILEFYLWYDGLVPCPYTNLIFGSFNKQIMLKYDNWVFF